MIARNCSLFDLRRALALANAHYAGNLRFKRLDPQGRGFRFTLGVFATRTGGRRSPAAPGVRRGYTHYWRDGHTPRLIAAACWHAHGHFFEALFSVAPLARIHAMGSTAHPGGLWITRDAGNWTDRNVGSQAYPLLFSDACDCDPDRVAAISRALTQEALA